MNDLINPSALPLTLALAVLIERLWEYFATPLTDQLPAAYRPIANRYGPVLPAAILCAAAGLNLLALTALLVSGGANLIHDLTQRR
jgi:hypothetical protein